MEVESRGGGRIETAKWYQFTVDLNNNSYDENTWYPCAPYDGISIYRRTHTFVVSPLYSQYGKPSWSTHTNGFYSYMEVTMNGNGYGVAGDTMYDLNATDVNWVNDVRSPCVITQMYRSSRVVYWLRGRAAYEIYIDIDVRGINVITDSYTVNGETVSPKTEPPDIPRTTSHVRAWADEVGNNIVNTYATKYELAIHQIEHVNVITSNDQLYLYLKDLYAIVPNKATFEALLNVTVSGLKLGGGQWYCSGTRFSEQYGYMEFKTYGIGSGTQTFRYGRMNIHEGIFDEIKIINY